MRVVNSFKCMEQRAEPSLGGACILMERAARQSKQVKGGRSEQSGKGLSGRRKCGGPGSVVNSAAKKALLRMR